MTTIPHVRGPLSKSLGVNFTYQCAVRGCKKPAFYEITAFRITETSEFSAKVTLNNRRTIMGICKDHLEPFMNHIRPFPEQQQ